MRLRIAADDAFAVFERTHPRGYVRFRSQTKRSLAVGIWKNPGVDSMNAFWAMCRQNGPWVVHSGTYRRTEHLSRSAPNTYSHLGGLKMAHTSRIAHTPASSPHRMPLRPPDYPMQAYSVRRTYIAPYRVRSVYSALAVYTWLRSSGLIGRGVSPLTMASLSLLTPAWAEV
jgi:hypothetical protein